MTIQESRETKKIVVYLLGIKSVFGQRVIENSEIETKYNLPEGWILEKTESKKVTLGRVI